MTGHRRKARVLAMQALFQWEAQGDRSTEALSELFAALESAPRAADYATQLVTGFWPRSERIDALLSGASRRWELARISPVERNVMRVALVEILDGRVSAKVALNEAIEIAREYGGEDSPRFVNGVLDEVLRRLRQRDADE